MTDIQIEISKEQIVDFCQRWKIVEFALFGSVLRDDFGSTSDIDILVVFEPDAPWSYWDWPKMKMQLSDMFGGHAIDLVERKCLRNPFRRHEILTTRRIVYAA